MTRRMTRALGFAVLMMLPFPAIGMAQGTGGIAGVVKDTTGAVLAGVTVDASSPALIEKVRSVVSDGDGQYKIIDLRPGLYTVTFTLPGFSTIKRDGVELTAGFTAAVNAELKVGDVAETVVVSGQSPIVDVQNVAQQRVMTRAVLDAIPTGKLYTGQAILIPGIKEASPQGTIHDVGGAAGYAFTQFSIHGGRYEDQQLQIDGMWIAVGTRGALLPQDGSTQEVGFNVAANAAENETGGVTINIIPKEGGNRLAGTVSGAFMNDDLQASNLTDDLRQRGLNDPNAVIKVWDVNGALGGPVKRDRLWFFSSWTKRLSDTYYAGVYYNSTPAAWIPTPDVTRQGHRDKPSWAGNGRLTWQASRKNKINFSFEKNWQCTCHHLGAAGLLMSPEASWRQTFDNRLVQLTWSAPVTNRLLLEVRNSYVDVYQDYGAQEDTVAASITELSSGLVYRSSAITAGGYSKIREQVYNNRAAVSYVTGSHAAKVGMDLKIYQTANTNFSLFGDVRYQLLNGVPRNVIYSGTPYTLSGNVSPNLGIYAQDQWTVSRLTLNVGVRYDGLRTDYPDITLPPAQFVTFTRQVTGAEVLNWKDLDPRLGASYDVFGNGRTALKVSLGRYVLQELLGVTNAVNPMSSLGGTNTRTWTDSNGDFIVQGDPLTTAANSELGPSSNLAFGTPRVTTRNGDWTTGFAKRQFNWETSAGIQHELLPGVSLNAMYFRRWYGNFRVTDNLAVGPADFSTYCVTARQDTRLPDGGGYQVCGLYDINPSKFGQTDNLVRLASDFGKQYEHWNGVDLTVNARLKHGVLLQGGMSTGKTTTDNCDVVSKVDNPSTRFCHVEEPFLTQVKLVGSFMLPWEVQVAGTYQNSPGTVLGADGNPTYIAANAIFTNAQIAPSLGRNLAAGAAGTVSVQLVDPWTMFSDRLSQVDLRVSRTFTLGRGRLRGIVDLYNALNANPVLVANPSYGTNGASWLVPTQILQARLLKFGVQLEF